MFELNYIRNVCFFFAIKYIAETKPPRLGFTVILSSEFVTALLLLCVPGLFCFGLELHQMLRQPRKVTRELHQVLHLPRKVTLELHQMLPLPRKLTLDLHLTLLYCTFTLLYFTLLYSTLLYFYSTVLLL